jgi:uncharacterized membrane protein YdjX (TVP38/TMEM64 family)
MKRVRMVLLWLNLAITLGCILAFVDSGTDVDTLLIWLNQAEGFVREYYLASILIYSTGLAMAVFYSVPANPFFYLASGYFFGGVEGAVISACAVSVGSYATYLFYRKIFSDTDTEKYRKLLPEDPTLLLALLRLSPWFPAPLINFYCGLVKVPPRVFVATTLCASLPLALVYTLISAEISAGFDLSTLYSGWVGVALSLLGGLSVIGLTKPVKLGLEMIKSSVSGLKIDQVNGHALLRSG